MSEQANLIDHFEDELQDIKEPSPFRWILGLFLIFMMVLYFIPSYQVQIDPPPARIPTVEEVSSITEYDRIESNNIQDYVVIDAEIKSVADRIATIACDSNQKKCQARAMFRFVQENFEYVSDPVSDEYYKTAKETIVNGGAMDCDDGSVAIATLLKSVGIPARFVFVPGHVYVEGYINNKWEPMDATCSNCNFGEIHYKYAKDEKRVVNA
jgi:transglutaminase-like putative cysteine protease